MDVRRGETGTQFGHFRASSISGNIDLPTDNINRGAIVLQARLDQLDNVNFPNNGYIAQFRLISALDALGSDDEYDQASRGAF